MEIRFQTHTLSQKETEPYQNFERLLQQHAAASARRRNWRWSAGAGLGLLAIGFLWYWLPLQPATTAPDYSAQRLDNTSGKPHQVAEYPLSEGAKTPADKKQQESAAAAPAQTNTNSEQRISSKGAPQATAPAHSPEAAPADPAKTPAPAPEKEAFVFTEARPTQGYPHLYAYFSDALQYPVAALEAQEEGTVILSFVIGEDGRPEGITLESGVSDELNAEAIRLVQDMPDWIPATMNGTYSPSRKTIPIIFKIY